MKYFISLCLAVLVASCGGGGGGGNSSTNSAKTDTTYSITIDYTGDPSYKHYFDEAAVFWSKVITADLPDIDGVDDLQIAVSFTSIDGAGGTLAQANFTNIRTDSGLPYRGFMQFDTADVQSLVSKNTMFNVVLHEMGHVLGFTGAMFQDKKLVNPSNGYQYVGTHALSQYQQLTNTPSASYVPLETQGGAGTVGSHWQEVTFGYELMSGYVNGATTAPLSKVTVGALEDLGYTVDYTKADPNFVRTSFAFSSPLSVDIPENTPITSIVTTANNSVYSLLTSQNVTAQGYFLIGTDSASLTINDQGQIFFKTSPVYSTKSAYNFTVYGQGNDNVLIQQSVTVNITPAQ